jgi:uncharacterized protein
MQYRKFGRSGFDVSALSFGCMRFPCDGHGNVIENEAVKMIQYAVDNGINYLDTAYVYHGGNSEVVLGKALKNGYRNKTRIATKLPVWNVEVPDDYDKLLDEQLKRLQTDNIDYYLLHALGADSWEKVKKLGLIEKSEKAVKSGKINHIGFSFHDGKDAFKKIIDGYDKWEFCQIQYNYMDTHNQAGTEGLKYAAEKNIPVIIMEPLLGGRLANPPENIMKIWNEYKIKRSPADWAFKWLWNQPEVTTVLSGMSSMKQMEENIRIADEAGKSLSADDLELIGKIVEKYKAQYPVPCTKCGYCMPCPSGVNIPRNMEIYNDAISHDDLAGARNNYKMFFPDAEKANQCVQCKVCEEKCPQKIQISDWLVKIQKALG